MLAPGASLPLSSFRGCRWLKASRGMSQSTQAGESEILRSLVVFFHGFAVTIHLFLLNKKNRCLGACWKHCSCAELRPAAARLPAA